MTKVFQIMEEEKQEAINLARQNAKSEIAERLIRDGVDTVVIMRATGFSKEQIKQIHDNMMVTK